MSPTIPPLFPPKEKPKPKPKLENNSFLGSGLALVWGEDGAYRGGPSCREEVDPPDPEVLRAGRDPASGVSRHLDCEPPRLIFVWAGDRVVLIASFKIFLLHFPFFDGKS